MGSGFGRGRGKIPPLDVDFKPFETEYNRQYKSYADKAKMGGTQSSNPVKPTPIPTTSMGQQTRQDPMEVEIVELSTSPNRAGILKPMVMHHNNVETAVASANGWCQSGEGRGGHYSMQMQYPEYLRVSMELEKRIETSYPRNVALFYYHSLSASGHHERLLRNQESTLKWDDDSFVKLPLSCRFSKLNGKHQLVPKWEIIRHNLQRVKNEAPYTDVDLGKLMEFTVSAYQSFNTNDFNFKLADDPALSKKLKTYLPIIVDHALQLETRLAKPIPILEAGKPQTLLLSRNLCCSLLANAFFCTFPQEFPLRRSIPDFNFFRLFHKGENDSRSNVKIEKLKCILEYFHQMERCNEEDNTVISFERKCITSRVQWQKSDEKLCPVTVTRNTGIEDAEGLLQVDFANKVVGGGVLNDGAVMEEIRFVVSPELIVARLFTETLGNNEVLVVTGTRQFSVYSGYSSTFQFRGGAPPKPQKKDALGREVTQVVAMDAYQFSSFNKSEQYSIEMIDRELHKCYVGFVKRTGSDQGVATGNWGCGAFNGDPEIKFLIQWMAASHVKRAYLSYYTGSDEKQASDIEFMVSLLTESNATVKGLYYALANYRKNVDGFTSWSRPSIFRYIHSMVR